MIQTIERSWCLYSSYSMHQSSNFSWICFFKQPASFISFPAYCKTARLYIYDFSVLVQRVLVFVWAIKIVTKITLKGFVGLLSPLPPLIVVERQSLLSLVVSSSLFRQVRSTLEITVMLFKYLSTISGPNISVDSDCFYFNRACCFHHCKLVEFSNYRISE